MSNPAHDPFYSSPFGPFYRRHSPYMVQPEYRIYEMNKRLQTRTEVSRPGSREEVKEENRVPVRGFAGPVVSFGVGGPVLEGLDSCSVHREGVHVMPKCQTFLR